MAADLHCHTRLSDGSTSIEELIFIAKNKGISTIAITDHDTFSGTKQAKNIGQQQGIEVIAGAEFSTFDYKRGRKAHILCYLCDHPERLEEICTETEQSRREAGMKMIEKVLTLYPISVDMVLKRAQESTNIFKQHIMHALMDAGYATSVYGELFRTLFDSKTGIAYADAKYPDVHQVIKQIHHAGGLAVLAHPGVYNSYELLDELIEQKQLDGVEVFHSRNREGDEERLKRIAKRAHLVMTGGTDFHGMYASHAYPLGACTTPLDQLKELIKRKQAIRKIL